MLIWLYFSLSLAGSSWQIPLQLMVVDEKIEQVDIQNNISFIDKAEKGDAEAQNSVGNAYRDGDGVEQDLKKALVWYKKAAEQGNEKAIEALERLGQEVGKQ